MATSSHAVFLSYASEDAPAAQRIAEALRTSGIEVWLDQRELRGGEAWDRKIRKEIHDCALFIPVISVNAHARVEGYFRLEWKLAVDRSHLIAPDQTFLLPVVIDGTPQTDERIPDRFRELQWSRAPGGEVPPAFIDRVKRLLSPVEAEEPTNGHHAAAPVPAVGERRASMRALQGPLRAGTPRRIAYATIAAAILTVGYFVLERLGRSGPGVPLGASIAVLPLANESGEASQQYFSDGISEDLITALSQFPGLKVIGRTSSFQFRDSKGDSRDIGARLGVAHLLEGSVRRSGEMVRVSAELIDTADGSTQWSEHYDRPYKDLFALQDEITHAVVGALRTKLLPGQHGAAQGDRPPGGSLDAYNALLEGRFYTFLGPETDNRKAIESYMRATQLDPRYAVAWSELSRVWIYLSINFLEGAAAQEAYTRAREAADRALALSPELALAHVERARVLQLADFDWRGAEAEFRRALALAPNNGEAKLYFGTQLAAVGQVEAAIELTRQAILTDPLRGGWYDWLAEYLAALNRLDEAEQAIRRAIELQPAGNGYHSQLAVIEVQRGRAQAALGAAQQEPPGHSQNFALAFALQIGTDRSAADAALRRLIETDGDFNPTGIADVYALRNDSEATFEWLDRAWSNRDTGIASLLYDPFILRYKDDPRFAAFCHKVGLPVPGEVRQKT